MIVNRHDSIPHLKEIFSKIFISNDPFNKMFVSSISSKILLFPTNGYQLSEKQFEAFISTIEMFGEQSFYLAEIEGDPFDQHKTCSNYLNEYLEINIDTSYDEYEKKNIMLENALYSPNGTWGIIISHESHAVFGGCKDMIATFKRFYPNWMNDQKKFLEYFEYWAKLSGSDLKWIKPFMEYINDNE